MHPYNCMLRVLEHTFQGFDPGSGAPHPLDAISRSDCITISGDSIDAISAYRDALQGREPEMAAELVELPLKWYVARNQPALTMTYPFGDGSSGGRTISFLGLQDRSGDGGDVEDTGYGIISVLTLASGDTTISKMSSWEVIRQPGGELHIGGIRLPSGDADQCNYLRGDIRVKNLVAMDPRTAGHHFRTLGSDSDMMSWCCIALRWLQDPAVRHYALEQSSEAIEKRRARAKSKPKPKPEEARKGPTMAPRIDDRPRIVVVSPDDAETLYAKREGRPEGTHASPRPHIRRAHRRVLRHERYRHARGRVVEVDTTRVGWREGEEFRVGKTIYAVMPKSAKSSPLQGMEI